MTQENYGYIIEVIVELQKRLASETASNKYLRQVKKELEDHSHKLFAENLALEKRLTEKDLLITQLQAEINAFDDTYSSISNQIAEQKETIETLQKSVNVLTESRDSLDALYLSLDNEYCQLVKKYQDLDTQYMTLKGLDNGK